MYQRDEPAAANAFIAAIVKKKDAGEVEVWPENWQAFNLFARLGTQWSVGAGGPTGLRYEAVYPLLDRVASTPDEWDALLDDVAVMEREALSVMHAKD